MSRESASLVSPYFRPAEESIAGEESPVYYVRLYGVGSGRRLLQKVEQELYRPKDCALRGNGHGV